MRTGQVRPGGLLPTLASTPDGSTGGSPKLELARLTWGYPLPGSGKLVYNARIESAGSPMWAEPFATGRSIVPVASFFEPHRSETCRNPRTGRLGKRSYEFHSADGFPLLLGAVAHGGRVSVVTTEPNASVEPVHPRMPLVLLLAEVATWLGSGWSSLADRSAISLESEPESTFEQPHGPEQLSLFNC